MTNMGWDQSRPVPWQRLVREWLIYVAIMAVAFVGLSFVLDDFGVSGALIGLLVSGPLYLSFGYLMAKFGYQRKSLKDLRTPQKSPRESSSASSESSEASTATRNRPAPTKRTGGGGNQPRKKRPRR